nr:unnamed protein product [Ananas comosus var. bracteatus]
MEGLNVLFSIRCQNKDVRINTRMEEVSSQQTSKAKNKGIKHQWTKHEDEKLIECLLDLSNSGQWRADNGTFRNGYLQQLERWMHEKIPDCELKGVPHIESRFKLWKRQYNAIFEMLGPSASGFGWSDKNKCVECDKNVYDNWVKSHPNAVGLRGKSFPYFEELSIVFGKDRATGIAAESPADAVANIEGEETNQRASAQNPDEEMAIADESSGLGPTNSSAGQSRKTRKRRSSATDDSINESFNATLRSIESMFGNASESISKLAGCFQFMATDAIRKEKLFEELLKVEGLVDKDRMIAYDILISDTTKLTGFYGIPAESRKDYIDAKQVVEIDDVHVPDQDPGVINVYFHIIDKLDCCGVQKFSQPGIFLRTEVAMHVLNKMQEYGKNNPVTADFVKDERHFESWNSLWSHSGAQDAAQLLAKWFASYFEHILEIPVGAPDVIFHKECQQQGSIEVDCGMYTCLFAERIVRNGLPDLSLYDNDPPPSVLIWSARS